MGLAPSAALGALGALGAATRQRGWCHAQKAADRQLSLQLGNHGDQHKAAPGATLGRAAGSENSSVVHRLVKRGTIGSGLGAGLPT